MSYSTTKADPSQSIDSLNSMPLRHWTSMRTCTVACMVLKLLCLWVWVITSYYSNHTIELWLLTIVGYILGAHLPAVSFCLSLSSMLGKHCKGHNRSGPIFMLCNCTISTGYMYFLQGAATLISVLQIADVDGGDQHTNAKPVTDIQSHRIRLRQWALCHRN